MDHMADDRRGDKSEVEISSEAGEKDLETNSPEWGTPLTCQRDGVGTLVRGQKFTLVRGRRQPRKLIFGIQP
jgi:hypothetical protein